MGIDWDVALSGSKKAFISAWGTWEFGANKCQDLDSSGGSVTRTITLVSSYIKGKITTEPLGGVSE